MSFTVSTSPSEDATTIRTLATAHVLQVFNERDEEARTAAIQHTYTEGIIWYELDDLVVGQAALNKRAAELFGKRPDFGFQILGDIVVAQNLGMLKWTWGPPEAPDLMEGVDVILVEGGKVKALWTALTKRPAA